MRTRVAVLADYASISEGGKLNVMGIFGIIYAANEPIVHSQMQLVLQLEFAPFEAGKKEIRVVLRDEDGRELLNLGGELMVPHIEGGEPAIVNQMLVFNNIAFPHFGDYDYAVSIDGEPVALIPLRVMKANVPPGGRA